MIDELQQSYERRYVTFHGCVTSAGVNWKTYAVARTAELAEDPPPPNAVSLADAFARESAFRSVCLGVIVYHIGADGRYLIVHQWLERHMSRRIAFMEQTHGWSEAPDHLDVCVWESVPLEHEARTYRALLRGDVTVEEWRTMGINGDVY